jgi:hypothetical protein
VHGKGLIELKPEQLQSFRHQLVRQIRSAGQVPAGPVETGDKAQPDRVTADGKDDRYGRGRWLRRQRRGGAGGYEYRYAAADEIGCEHRQPIKLIFRPAVFNCNVLALDVAGFLQALEKRNGDVLCEKMERRPRNLWAVSNYVCCGSSSAMKSKAASCS